MNNFGVLGYAGNPYTADLNHSKANLISYFHEDSNVTLFECAFFRGRNWVVEDIEELAPWATQSDGNTRVYRYVPTEVLDSFLSTFAR